MELVTLSIVFMVGLFLGWFVLKRPAWAETFWAWASGLFS